MFLKVLIALQDIKIEYQKIANLLDNVLNQHLSLRQEIGLK